MKGKLIKTEGRWVVRHPAYIPPHEYELPLHPDDVKQIQRDSERFDNIEARIAGYPDVEFEIVKENVDTGALEAPYIEVNFAKLIESETVCEYSGLPAVSEYIGDDMDSDKIEGILDRALAEATVYTKLDLRKALEYGYERGLEHEFTTEQEEWFYESLKQQKNETNNKELS
jgi:hypothetical protein